MSDVFSLGPVAIDDTSSAASLKVSFDWKGGRGLIVLSSYSTTGGVTLDPSITIPGIAGDFNLFDLNGGVISLNVSGSVFFDAPAGRLSITMNNFDAGDNVAWASLDVVSVERES